MKELVIIDEADQLFTTIIAGYRCTFRFRWNVSREFWSFDLKIGDEDVIHGRRVVVDSDLLRAYNLPLGILFAVDYEQKGNIPDRQNLPDRRIRIYQYDEVSG